MSEHSIRRAHWALLEHQGVGLHAAACLFRHIFCLLVYMGHDIRRQCPDDTLDVRMIWGLWGGRAHEVALAGSNRGPRSCSLPADLAPLTLILLSFWRMLIATLVGHCGIVPRRRRAERGLAGLHLPCLVSSLCPLSTLFSQVLLAHFSSRSRTGMFGQQGWPGCMYVWLVGWYPGPWKGL